MDYKKYLIIAVVCVVVVVAIAKIPILRKYSGL